MVEVTGVSVESVALVVLEYKLGSASKIAVSTNIYGSSTFFSFRNTGVVFFKTNGLLL